MTPGEADKNARKNAKHNSVGDANTYFKAYRGFQRDYRKKYSRRFMENLGYAPSSTAETRVATKASTATYLQVALGYATITVESVTDKFLTLVERYNHAVRTISGYDFPTGQIIISGMHYNNHQYVEGVDETEIVITSTRLYDETIIQNLTDNYAYDGTYVTIAGEVYTVGTISSAINGSDQYETVCTHPTLPDEIIYTDVERIVNNIVNSIYGGEATYVSYRVTSGEVGTELRYFVAVADTLPIYERVTLDVTTIVPMKENNVMVDTDDRKLNRMLKRLNLSGEQLKGSIENPDMDSAYLMTGIDPQYNDPVINMTLFKMFDYISAGSGDIVISISQLNIRYGFSISKSTTSGTIGPVGTYTRSQSGSGAGVVMTLRYQADSNDYQTITISNFEMTYTISGNPITAYLDSTGGYCRLIIPLDLMNSLKYQDFVWVYERSLCMLAFSIETVRVQWYETAAFGTLLKIVAIVIIIFTLGSGTAIMNITNVFMQSLAEMGIAFGMGLYYSILALEMVLIGAVASAVFNYVADKFGGNVGAILAAVGTLVAAYYGANGGFTQFTSQQWLTAANNALSTYNQYIQHKMQELQRDSEAFLADIKEKTDDLLEKLKEYDNDITSTFNDRIGIPNEMYDTIERYCNSVVSTGVDNLVDYDTMIQNAIMARTTVWSGP